MTDKKRTYTKRARAQQEARTRLRITECAVELHGTIGPARTSISALARRAGVRRSTVYRYFPDEAAVFAACSAHWLAANPIPETGRWAAISDPDERLSSALRELYAYYARNRQMIENILRDESALPYLAMTVEPYRAFLAHAREVLLAGRGLRGARTGRVAAAIGHALAFSTWRSLCVEQGLPADEAAALMCDLVRAAAGEDTQAVRAAATRKRAPVTRQR